MAAIFQSKNLQINLLEIFTVSTVYNVQYSQPEANVPGIKLILRILIQAIQ